MLNLKPYEPLEFDEILFVIAPYWDEADRKPMGYLIRNNSPMSDGMRHFIADVLEGKVARPNGKRGSNWARDIQIFALFDDMVSDRSITHEKASVELGNRFNLSEEAIIGIYKKVKKEYK